MMFMQTLGTTGRPASVGPGEPARRAVDAPFCSANDLGLKGRTLIVGLGKTGLSCARFLARRGLSIAVTDSRDNPPGLAALTQELPGVALFLGGFDDTAFVAADGIIVSPGVALQEPAIAAAIARGKPVLGDIELFARCVAAPVIAVTGSNGKSTVTALVGEMARLAGRDARIGGNLGTPALELLEEGVPDMYVLELSSFQLETTSSLNAKAAVVLNVSPDHLDRYRNVGDYLAAKRRIYRGDGVMVLNRDDASVATLRNGRRRCMTFGLNEPADDEDYGVRIIAGAPWLVKGAEALVAASTLRIRGRHNLSNALAALALGETAGLEREPMLEALRKFPGLPHRTQWVAEIDGVQYYNDSKGTNIGATIAAINGLPHPIVLIAGGLGKDQDFSLLRAVVKQHVRAVVLIGRDAYLIEEALDDVVPVSHALTMDDAIAMARNFARPGDTVLLSPACASFDMFNGFEHRGDTFVAAVKGLVS